MRPVAIVLVAAALLFGIYEFRLKKIPATDTGTAPTQAISLTGVRSDLLQIAQAERASNALNGHCVALEELVSSGALQVVRSGRDGYTYEINCSESDFHVVAEHPPAPEGSGIRYLTLSIDSLMRVQEVSSH